MFNFFKKEETVVEETPQFIIEDSRSTASLTVHRGEKYLGHISYRETNETWMFIPMSPYVALHAEELISIARKLEELNDEN